MWRFMHARRALLRERETLRRNTFYSQKWGTQCCIWVLNFHVFSQLEIFFDLKWKYHCGFVEKLEASLWFLVWCFARSNIKARTQLFPCLPRGKSHKFSLSVYFMTETKQGRSGIFRYFLIPVCSFNEVSNGSKMCSWQYFWAKSDLLCSWCFFPESQMLNETCSPVWPGSFGRIWTSGSKDQFGFGEPRLHFCAWCQITWQILWTSLWCQLVYRPTLHLKFLLCYVLQKFHRNLVWREQSHETAFGYVNYNRAIKNTNCVFIVAFVNTRHKMNINSLQKRVPLSVLHCQLPQSRLKVTHAVDTMQTWEPVSWMQPWRLLFLKL